MLRPNLNSILRSLLISFGVIALMVGVPLYSQYRSVDQGKGGTVATNVWLVKICDSAGANCGTVAIPVTITGTMPVTGTVQSNAGTGTVNVTCISGCGGAPSFLDTGGFTFGTTPVGIFGAVVDTAASHTIGDGLAGAPRMSTNRILLVSPQGTTTVAGTLTGITGTVNATPVGTSTITGTVTVTSGTIGSITMPSLTVTSGTIGSITMPSLTVTSGTVNSATITQLPVVNVGTLPTVNVGTFGPAINVGTFGPALNIGTFGPTAAVNLTQVLGAALSTANPVIDGGRVATDTVAAVANGSPAAVAVDKYGRLIIVMGGDNGMLGVGTTSVTATTAAQILASSGGANYRWAITSIMTCNLSGVVATQLDVTDSSGTLMSFPWTQTATTAGESRCYMQQFPTPYLSAANSTISVKLTVANATGVRTNITAYKTGT